MLLYRTVIYSSRCEPVRHYLSLIDLREVFCSLGEWRNTMAMMAHLDAAPHLIVQLLLQTLRVRQRRLAVRRLRVQVGDDLRSAWIIRMFANSM